jgi:hypothetical protein
VAARRYHSRSAVTRYNEQYDMVFAGLS